MLNHNVEISAVDVFGPTTPLTIAVKIATLLLYK